MDDAEIRSRIQSAFAELQRLYGVEGGWRYPGYLDADEQHGYIGPFAWSEADVKRRFAAFLDERLPGAVHMEMPIRPGTRSDLDPLPPGARAVTKYIDIVVSDLSGMPDDYLEAGSVFRGRRHEAFIEAKWFPKASERWFWDGMKRFKEQVPGDVTRLAVHKARGRCSIAAMFIVDDDGRYVASIDELDLSPEVDLLILTPDAGPGYRSRGVGDRHRRVGERRFRDFLGSLLTTGCGSATERDEAFEV
jgi:hypothetical protein